VTRPAGRSAVVTAIAVAVAASACHGTTTVARVSDPAKVELYAGLTGGGTCAACARSGARRPGRRQPRSSAR
jgi:hypothetical protein